MLFDADKLDAIGAIGVARAYLFAGEVGARLHAPEVDVADSRPYTADIGLVGKAEGWTLMIGGNKAAFEASKSKGAIQRAPFTST